MLSTNKKTLDTLNKGKRLKPSIYFFIILLLIVIALFLYLLFYYPSQNSLEQSGNVKSNITAKLKSFAASRNNSICSYELKNGEIITLGCPSDIFILDREVNLIKITKPSGYVYYEVEDELMTKLNSLTQHSTGTHNGAP